MKRVVIAEFNATNVVLGFDYEASDNSSSDLEDSHKVFYAVLATTDNPNINIEKAKLRFRKTLPTGKFLFGFEIDEVEETNAAIMSQFKDIVANLDYPSDEDDLAPETRVSNYSDQLLLQFSDSEERDAELEVLRNLWSSVAGKINGYLHHYLSRFFLKF